MIPDSVVRSISIIRRFCVEHPRCEDDAGKPCPFAMPDSRCFLNTALPDRWLTHANEEGENAVFL